MYLFYLDESGQREYNAKSSRHFVLGAVAISDGDWREWNQKINAIKQGCFGTTQVEWKSVNLRQPDKCRRFYLEPFGITQEKLTGAVEEMFTLINAAPLTLFAAVTDKRQMMTQYAAPVPSTEMAYELLLERGVGFLSRCDNAPYGIIIHDLIQESASSEVRSHQKAILELHDKFQNRGRTDFVSVEKIIEGVHFLPTDQSNFLQVADLVAYNVYRQFADHWEQWEEGKSLSRMTQYEFFGRLLPKFYKSGAGVIKGYGIKKFPKEVGKK